MLTLKEFPEVNSTTDGRSVRWHSQVHLGLAVSLEQGLVVPVIRNAGELTLGELNARAKELAEKARSGKLAPDEMSGSTFTISNMGMLDVENFTAIINPGESAILAVSSTMKKAVVRDDKVVVRSMMKLTLSSDHRIIDGAMAARFVNALKQEAGKRRALGDAGGIEGAPGEGTRPTTDTPPLRRVGRPTATKDWEKHTWTHLM